MICRHGRYVAVAHTLGKIMFTCDYIYQVCPHTDESTLQCEVAFFSEQEFGICNPKIVIAFDVVALVLKSAHKGGESVKD